ncbi:unnamed protein product [Notodromas monacha]|uniref:Tudor domain-containing protein n=1 Tax=Notodromas monacha TaxID=399045 RepID=A0A7R9BXM1_9CRUS|nr:unnamed protein product [Notodromas monacha]CAG0923658.1 unnamed protein product [Notodromas monacha]
MSTAKSLAKSDASVAAVLIPLCESGEKVITELFEDFGAEPKFATAFPCSTPAPSPVRMSIISRRESLENGGEEDGHFEVLSKSAFESSVGFNKMDEFDYLETGELQEQATFNFSAMMSEVLITKPTRTPATQNITNPYKTITISSISMYDCLVTSISSQDDFWVQLAENALELEELMLQISSSTKLVQMPLPKIGDPCLFMVTPGLVLRGLIVETDSSLSVSVVAVDFGCIQEVLPRHIFEIEDKFLEPPQFAVHCGIVQYPQNMDSIEWLGTYQMLFSEFFRDMNSGKYFVEHFQHWNEDDYYVQT